MLGIEPQPWASFARATSAKQFDELNERTGFGLDPLAVVRTLRTAEQQKVEILRAIARDARLLADGRADRGADARRDRAAARHRPGAGGGRHLDRARLALPRGGPDRLRHGHLDAKRADRDAPRRASEETPETLVAAMIGRDVSLEFPPKAPPPASTRRSCSTCAGSAAGATSRTSRSPSGRARSSGSPAWSGAAAPRSRGRIFGADHLDAGEILFEGRPVVVKGPRQAARLGIAMLPESRKEQGLFMIRPVRENISIVDVQAIARLGVVDRRAEGRRTRRARAPISTSAPPRRRRW